MEAGSRFYSATDEFRLEAKWLVDPKHLFVGPRIGEGAHAKVYEGKYELFEDLSVLALLILLGSFSFY